METFWGIGIGGGLAKGNVRIQRSYAYAPRAERSGSAEEELARFEAAKTAASEELVRVCEKAKAEVGLVQAALFEGYVAMVADPELQEAVERKLRGEAVTAECAVTEAAEHFATLLEASDDTYMQARASDVRYVAECILRGFGANASVGGNPAGDSPIILCAEDITAEMVVTVDTNRVVGLLSAGGTKESHSAVLAELRGIPAVFGIGAEAFATLCDGQAVLLNAETGEVTTNPERIAAAVSGTEAGASAKAEATLRSEMAGTEAETESAPYHTIDGVRVRILANLANAADAANALRLGAEGVGLFRSEGIFLGATTWPSEELQYEQYRQVLETMGERPVVIRTLDLGGDKLPAYAKAAREDNPALGLRGIRFGLAHPEQMRTQLRALYRASVHGNLGILFPMITSEAEVAQAVSLCESVKNELAAEGIRFDPKVRLGIMIETPAAALISDRLAPMVDFFSIGTNDLTQYTLACDRLNPSISHVREENHEAVLRLIAMTVENAAAHEVPVCVCGDMAGDETMAKTLVRMGIREVSVAARRAVVICEQSSQ